MAQYRVHRTIVIAYTRIGGTEEQPVWESTDRMFVVQHETDEPDWDKVLDQAQREFPFAWDMIECITPVPNPDGPTHYPRGYGAPTLQILHPRTLWAR